MTAPRARPYRRSEMGWIYKRSPGWIHRRKWQSRIAFKKRMQVATEEAIDLMVAAEMRRLGVIRDDGRSS